MAGKSTLSEERERQIKILALKGFTDAEMASVVGVTEQTFNNWKKQKPTFFESLKDWKAEADEKVERSLFERATGYKHPAVHVLSNRVKTLDLEGKTITEKTEPLIVDIQKEYAPDPVSMIFWLKNRKRKEWSDKQDIAITDETKLDTPEEVLRRLAFMLRNKKEV